MDYAKNFLALLLAIICSVNSLPAGTVTQDNIYEYVLSDKESVANYICNNLEALTKEVNSLATDETDTKLAKDMKEFQARSCEERISVHISGLDKEVEGIYLDFNGNNGYMIVLDDYTVISFEVKGDLTYLKGKKNIYYSIYDGFGYYNKQNNFVPYEKKEMTRNEKESWTTNSKKYDGQDTAGDGTITSPEKYVKSRYGSGYSIYTSKSLSGFKYVKQWDMSIYIEKKNGQEYSEGNCTLTSIYAMMNYLKIKGRYPKLPSDSKQTNYNAARDSFYAKYKSKSNYRIIVPKRLPDFYLATRKYAVDILGYQVSDINPLKISSIIKNVGKRYNSNINAKDVWLWSFESQVVNEIKAGYPTMWNCANSSTYGSHSTVVTGYSTYRKKSTILGLTYYKYVNLMKLNDCWASDGRYFDYTSYNGFGSFVRVR